MSHVLDLQKMIFSLVLIRPKKNFFDWLIPILKRNEMTMEEVFFPEECGVWIIPAIGTFNDEVDFQFFLEKMKPLIVKEELGRFGPSSDDVPEEIGLEFCNELFDFEIRDRASLMKEPVQI